MYRIFYFNESLQSPELNVQKVKHNGLFHLCLERYATFFDQNPDLKVRYF